MYTTFRITRKELNAGFLETLKSLFTGDELEISVSSADETAYLMRSKANKKRLLKSIKNIKTGKNLIEVDIAKLK